MDDTLRQRIEQATANKIDRYRSEAVQQRIRSKVVEFCECLICERIRQRRAGANQYRDRATEPKGTE